MKTTLRLVGPATIMADCTDHMMTVDEAIDGTLMFTVLTPVAIKAYKEGEHVAIFEAKSDDGAALDAFVSSMVYVSGIYGMTLEVME